MSVAFSSPQQGVPIALGGRPKPPQQPRIVPGIYTPGGGRRGNRNG